MLVVESVRVLEATEVSETPNENGVVKKKRGRPATGLKRTSPYPNHFTIKERQWLDECAARTNLTLAEYIRCQLFGYSYESQGGHPPRRPLIPPKSLLEEAERGKKIPTNPTA